MSFLLENQQLLEDAVAVIELIKHDDEDVTLAEEAARLDDNQVRALQAWINAIIAWDDDEHMLPVDISDVPGFSAAICAATLLSLKLGAASVPQIRRLFGVILDADEQKLIDDGPEILADVSTEAAMAWLDTVQATKERWIIEFVVMQGIILNACDKPALQQAMAPKIIDLLKNFRLSEPMLTTQFVLAAREWKLTAAAEFIEHAFSENLVDCGLVGDWESVRQRLEVPGLGLPMPENPLDPTRQYRRKVGLGHFSSAPLFDDEDEIDDDAHYEYLSKATSKFRDSKWAPNQPDEMCGSSIRTFLDMALSYERAHAENLTVREAKRVLLELYPQKVSQPASESNRTIDELVAFWRFCDQDLKIENAASLANNIDNWRAEFHRAMSNPANFGPAKQFYMAGVEQGFDMHSDSGVMEFVANYNNLMRSQDDVATSRYDAPEAQPQANLFPKDLKARKKLLKKLKGK